jgi:hypothetical protein
MHRKILLKFTEQPLEDDPLDDKVDLDSPPKKLLPINPLKYRTPSPCVPIFEKGLRVYGIIIFILIVISFMLIYRGNWYSITLLKKNPRFPLFFLKNFLN